MIIYSGFIINSTTITSHRAFIDNLYEFSARRSFFFKCECNNGAYETNLTLKSIVCASLCCYFIARVSELL